MLRKTMLSPWELFAVLRLRLPGLTARRQLWVSDSFSYLGLREVTETHEMQLCHPDMIKTSRWLMVLLICEHTDLNPTSRKKKMSDELWLWNWRFQVTGQECSWAEARACYRFMVCLWSPSRCQGWSSPCFEALSPHHAQTAPLLLVPPEAGQLFHLICVLLLERDYWGHVLLE